jgi:Holliday junction resolvase
VTNYAAGTRVERIVRHHLESEGYVVTRSAGSKGWIDLAARKPGQLLDVQVKRDPATRLCAADWDRLIERAEWVGAIPILATRSLHDQTCLERHRTDGVRCYVMLWRLTGMYVPRAPFARQPAERFVTDLIAAGRAP